MRQKEETDTVFIIYSGLKCLSRSPWLLRYEYKLRNKQSPQSSGELEVVVIEEVFIVGYYKIQTVSR